MPSMKHTSPLLRYGVAVLAIGMAFLVKLLLDPLIVQETPFLLIFGAIMISAWYGGLGPGLLATVAAGLATDYFFLQPTSSFSGFSLETVPLLAFFLEGTLVCLLVEALRAARSRAEGSTLEAERQREHLRRNEEHFRSLVEGMRDYAIFTLDPQGCVASWNAGAERLEGYNSEEIVGEHFSVFFTEVDTKLGKPEEHLEAASEGRSVEENWLVRKDGSRFWADTILTALHDDEGKLRVSRWSRRTSQRRKRRSGTSRRPRTVCARSSNTCRQSPTPGRSAEIALWLTSVRRSRRCSATHQGR
jgi:PAS domain S-box-containing protein